MEATKLTVLKDALREIIDAGGYIPDQESFNLLYQVVRVRRQKCAP